MTSLSSVHPATIADPSEGKPGTTYGREELEAAATTLGDALDDAGIAWSLVGPGADFASVDVGGPVTSTDCATQERDANIARTTIGDTPVTIVAEAGDAVRL